VPAEQRHLAELPQDRPGRGVDHHVVPHGHLQQRGAAGGRPAREPRVQQAGEADGVQGMQLVGVASQRPATAGQHDHGRDDEAGLRDEGVEQPDRIAAGESHLLAGLSQRAIDDALALVEPAAREGPLTRIAPAGDSLDEQHAWIGVEVEDRHGDRSAAQPVAGRLPVAECADVVADQCPQLVPARQLAAGGAHRVAAAVARAAGAASTVRLST
jgi:hypothetical protein